MEAIMITRSLIPTIDRMMTLNRELDRAMSQAFENGGKQRVVRLQSIHGSMGRVGRKGAGRRALHGLNEFGRAQ